MEVPPKVSQTPEWQSNIIKISIQFAMQTELNYAQALNFAQKQLPLPETPSKESLDFMIKHFYNAMIGCSVALTCKTIGTNPEVEESMIDIVRIKFKRIRQQMAEQELKNSAVKLVQL